MTQQPRQIFRQGPLERLASPERLDELLAVVRPQSWLLLLTLGVGLALVAVWSVVGRIPVTAGGTAILVRPKQVVAFQASTAGQIASLRAAVGDEVRRGDLLARLDLPELEQELEQERTKLSNFDLRSGEMGRLERELAEKELGFLADQRVMLEQRIASLCTAAEDAQVRSRQLIEQQRINIDTARKLSTELGETLQKRHESFKALESEGLVANDVAFDARSRIIDKQLELASLDVQEQELRLRENQSRETYDKQMDQAQDLRMQLKNLELREMGVSSKLRELELGKAGERQEIQRRVEQLQGRLESEGRVVSEYDGRILELTSFVGQRVDLGARLGKLEIEDTSAELKALAYFDVGAGKQVRPGLAILVAPSMVQRERYGSIVGRVLNVSDYPVTTEAAANQVGDLELARDLLDGRSRIEVLASLEPDARTPSGFAWTSGSGPDGVQVTAGTTAQVRVTIEERAPITFVLPFLRSLSGT